jgi:diadenosine hexaphosphate hydrolase (ATP-forming)
LAQLTAVSAGAIILCEIDGTLKIALAQHQRSTKTWALPKGHVEAGESIEQAALREIHEETGLAHVQLLTYLGSIMRESIKSNGDIVQKTIHFFLAYALTREQTQAPLDQAFIDVGWFSPREALELLYYEQDREFLREHLGLLFA